ncbi:MAG TPA: hypothetical protein VGK97_00230 [Spongiibacteraceae bacterium]
MFEHIGMISGVKSVAVTEHKYGRQQVKKKSTEQSAQLPRGAQSLLFAALHFLLRRSGPVQLLPPNLTMQSRSWLATPSTENQE